jgi:hypothetical protein
MLPSKGGGLAFKSLQLMELFALRLTSSTPLAKGAFLTPLTACENWQGRLLALYTLRRRSRSVSYKK